MSILNSPNPKEVAEKKIDPKINEMEDNETKVSLGFVCATKFCAGRKKSKRGQRNMTSLTIIDLFTYFS